MILCFPDRHAKIKPNPHPRHFQRFVENERIKCKFKWKSFTQSDHLSDSLMLYAISLQGCTSLQFPMMQWANGVNLWCDKSVVVVSFSSCLENQLSFLYQYLDGDDWSEIGSFYVIHRRFGEKRKSLFFFVLRCLRKARTRKFMRENNWVKITAGDFFCAEFFVSVDYKNKKRFCEEIFIEFFLASVQHWWYQMCPRKKKIVNIYAQTLIMTWKIYLLRAFSF